MQQQVQNSMRPSEPTQPQMSQAETLMQQQRSAVIPQNVVQPQRDMSQNRFITQAPSDNNIPVL